MKSQYKNLIKTLALTGLLAIITSCSVEKKHNNSSWGDYENPVKTKLAYSVERSNYIARVTNTSQYVPGVITGARLQKIQSDINVEYKDGTNVIGEAHYLGTYNIGDNSVIPVARNWKLLDTKGMKKQMDDEMLNDMAEETYHLTGPL